MCFYFHSGPNLSACFRTSEYGVAELLASSARFSPKIPLTTERSVLAGLPNRNRWLIQATACASGRQALSSGRELRHAIPQMVGFAFSFAVVGLFWLAHHGLFRHIKGVDRPLVLLNLLFLGTIAFVPYPAALLSAAGDQVAATVFYAASLAAVGLAEAAVWLYAIRIRELALPEVSPAVRRFVLLRILRTPVVFLLSIPVALVWPNLAKWLWLLIFVGGFVLRRFEPAEDEPAATKAATEAGARRS